jgi:hypothetical protein
VFAALLQRRQHGLNVVLHEQHRGDDDVTLGNVAAAAFQRRWVIVPFGRGVHFQRQSGQLACQCRSGACCGARNVAVHRHNDESQRRSHSSRARRVARIASALSG